MGVAVQIYTNNLVVFTFYLQYRFSLHLSYELLYSALYSIPADSVRFSVGAQFQRVPDETFEGRWFSRNAVSIP